jgi:hypothetical protein
MSMAAEFFLGKELRDIENSRIFVGLNQGGREE